MSPTFQRVIAFSGGRTSAFMLRQLMDAHPDFPTLFRVLFCNTGREYDATLDFVHEVETRWGVPVVWLEYARAPAVDIDPSIYPSPKSRKTVREQQEKRETSHWFRVVDYKTARRRHEPNGPFDELLGWANVLPNVANRMCSVQMKIRTMMRYLFSQGVYQWADHIGIRADEAHRALDILANSPKYTQPTFPLIDAGVTVDDVDAYWVNSPFDLQLESRFGNCDLCFLKARWKKVNVAIADPSALPWWLAQEEAFGKKTRGDGGVFRQGQSYIGIKAEAEHPQFDFSPKDAPDVCLSCSDGGYRMRNEDLDEASL